MNYYNISCRTDADDVEGESPQGPPAFEHRPATQQARTVPHSTSQSEHCVDISSSTQIEEDSRFAKPQSTQFKRTAIRPPPRAGFFYKMGQYDYIMPDGPALNFTIADILVILPHWYKNLQICQRFQNNGLNSSVHMAILQEHRDIALEGTEISRAKDAISDQYRKTMRMVEPKWRKTTHKAPGNWDPNALAVNQFVPHSAREEDHIALASISFSSMIHGISKLPQGSDAGDLTRALSFALLYQKPGRNGEAEEYLFPDDLHDILEHVGYTIITDSHTDRAIIGRNEKFINETMNLQRKRRNELQSAGYLAAPLPKRRHVAKAKPSAQPAQKQYPHLLHTAPGISPTMSCPKGVEEIFSYGPGFTEIDEASVIYYDNDFLGLLTTSPERSLLLQQLDESLESLQPPVWVNKTHYPDTQLLRGCVEADYLDDHSNLARAARYSRRPYSYAADYVVGQVDLILGLEEVLGNVLE
jgi:hypothetical protein